MNSMPPPKMTELAEPAFVSRSDDIINEVNHNRIDSSSSSTTSGSSDGDDFFHIDANDLSHPFSSGPVHSLPPLPPSARTDVPDPNRIPSSIFARTNTTNPTDWSVASNESLFSIQMGNASFSRDHVFHIGRSGELTNFSGRSGKLTNISGNGFPPISSPPPFPTVMTIPTPISPVPGSPVSPVGQRLGQPVVAEANNEEAIDEVQRASAEGEHDSDKENSGLNSAKNSINYSSRVSRLSDSSISSIQSFAFPILTGDGRNISAKAEPEQQQMKPQQIEQQPPNVTENMNTSPAIVEEKGWFSCFSCCRLSLPRT